MIDVCLLGCGGMMPLPKRYLTSLLYRFKGNMILIDCGEGTQIPIKLAGWGFKKIEAICFTHYHADHTAGLPGLLLTLTNSHRKKPLTLFGPPGLKEVVDGLTVIAPVLSFDLKIVELSDECTSINKIGDVFIKSIPVDHSIQCLSYSMQIKRPGKFNVKKAEELNIPKKFWNVLQKGNTVKNQGDIYKPGMVLGEKRKGLKVTYCTDTRPTGKLVDFSSNSDIFICEGMYGEEKRKITAIEKKHMTFQEAATLAKQGKSKELWLTHYSPSLKNPHEFINNATNIFPNTILGRDLMKKSLIYES